MLQTSISENWIETDKGKCMYIKSCIVIMKSSGHKHTFLRISRMLNGKDVSL